MLRDEDGQVTLIDMGLPSSGAKVIAALALDRLGPERGDPVDADPLPPRPRGWRGHVSRETGRPVDMHAADAEYVRTGTQPDADPSSRIGKLFRRLPEPKKERVTVGEELTRRAGGAVRRRDQGGAHAGALTRARVLPARGVGGADHRRRDLQRARQALAAEDAVLRLRDDQADGPSARRAGVLDGGVHPWPGDPGEATRGDPEVPGQAAGCGPDAPARAWQAAHEPRRPAASSGRRARAPAA